MMTTQDVLDAAMPHKPQAAWKPTAKPAMWLPVTEGRKGVFLTRNKKMVVFADPVTTWHINKYGLTHWLEGVPTETDEHEYC
jgi:hypothetical protein